MTDYTKLRNKNRGYMKLEVWQKSIELFKLVKKVVYDGNKIDFKLRVQVADSAQSVSSNIAEGYSRRSIEVNWAKRNWPDIRRTVSSN